MEGPRERRPGTRWTGQRRLEPVAPVRGGRGEIERRVGIHRDEAATRREVPRDGLVHLLQLGAIARVVEQIRRHHEVTLRLQRDGACITDEVLHAKGVRVFLFTRQLDHLGGQINAEHASGPALAHQARVKSLAARKVQHPQAGWVADQAEEGECLNVPTPRLLFGALVVFRDRIVVCGHVRRSISLPASSGQPRGRHLAATWPPRRPLARRRAVLVITACHLTRFHRSVRRAARWR